MTKPSAESNQPGQPDKSDQSTSAVPSAASPAETPRKRDLVIGLVLTGVTMALLARLYGSAQVCPPGGGCTLLGLFGAGLRRLTPLLLVRFAADFLYQAAGFWPARLAVGLRRAEIGLAIFDCGILLYLLARGVGHLVDLAYLKSLTGSAVLVSVLPWAFAAPLLVTLLFSIRSTVRKLRRPAA
ncbi:MAG: hypothetical protein A2087_05315 [Spirochaetes bacterium GWD1_61_31]|nr:MAG: hypothetical protein A2Y37_10620 [Spirochaetes bacterium GWB1_60_80]OHD29775.1 MAG: hypothetical protein A2004_04895 [Spirochaetes bacterium GWC1_61_12]OHD42883.1 MAG: hypothetical protein A2Y35_13895 [Spirochaetes bacterium GWE1_60_18]OHD43460.1 MAG: hypothetical protein A2087_05315 [Spirochaetes bacterium GWD1_61_31]OHD59579.1 MAG: hypothetical protein A2Y32_12660 [Spirochaetes bacterium GWF1_60_12]HAP43747.1 hypothetical protein [Spirochaetaceae bacterium]